VREQDLRQSRCAKLIRMRTLLLALALSLPLGAQTVVEYPIAYPNAPSGMTGSCHPAPGGSTHEITFASGGHVLWITGQSYDEVVRVTETGAMTFYPMPSGSGPHGVEFDADGRLWVTLEFSGQIVRLDANGKIDRTIDVHLDCPTCAPGQRLNTHPHGMGFGADGRTIWFTGKATGTIGRIAQDGRITTYVLPTVGSVPIYVRAGNDKAMWVTELAGNAIARIAEDGSVHEYAIPTHNSRPIAIVPEPGGKKNMWFSEEAGNRIGRITTDGTIDEYPLPLTQLNVILAGLGFDRDGNLWVQQYVDQNAPAPANPSPAGNDYIVRVDKSILTTSPKDISSVPITYYKVPSTQTVMHRILQGPDGNIWFTELATNRVGKLMLAP
jgi:virginiamycin B lyase